MALSTWSAILGITLELEQQGGANYMHNTTSDPNRNMIYFNYVSDSPMKTTSRTFNDTQCAVGECTNASWLYKSDIDIRLNTDWFFNPTGLGNTTGTQASDFHGHIIHEIGHALGLGHDIAYVTDPVTGNIVIL